MKLIDAFKFAFILSFAILVHAQEECPGFVMDALESIGEVCTDLARNQVCYANRLVTAEIRPDEQELHFDEPGNVLNLEDIESLELAPMNLEEQVWGVALLLIQANLPNTIPGQNVPLLAFGEVQLSNEVERLTRLSVTATSRVRVREAPNSEVNNIIAALDPGQTAIAIGRLESGTWLRVALDENLATLGWVSSDFVTVDGDINSLAIMDETTVISEPMDAFTFSTGIGQSLCTEAPDDGILVQTPEGVASITIVANGVRVTLGSTAYLQAEDGEMRVFLLEGRGLVTANDVSQYVPAGTFITVPLGNDGKASSEPGFPQAYDEQMYQSLPGFALPRPIEPVPALPTEEIEATINHALPMNGDWQIAYSWNYNCGTDSGSDSTEMFSSIVVSEDGSSLTYLDEIIFTRAADGVYTNIHTVRTPGYDNIFTYTFTFTSPVAMIFELTIETVPLADSLGGACSTNYRGTGRVF